MFDSQIVITGVGFVSAMGSSPLVLWQNAHEGGSMAEAITAFSTDPFSNAVSAPVKNFEAPITRKHKQPWTCSNAVQFAVSAARDALVSASVLQGSELRTEAGVVFGSTLACLDLLMKLDQDAITNGARTVDPMLFPDIGASAPSCRVSQQLGLQGFNTILANGQTSSLDAIHYGALLISQGVVPIVLVGGVEELTRSSFLYHAHTLGTERSGTDDCFEQTDLRGLFLGEGSAVLVLETLQHAQQRGARVMAEVLGFGTSFCTDGPRSKRAVASAISAMQLAMHHAGVEPDQIDIIFRSSGIDRDADMIESAAIEQVVSGHSFFDLKRTLGELNSAMGAMQAAIGATLVDEGTTRRKVVLAEEHEDKSFPYVCLINTFSSSDSASSFSSLVLGVPRHIAG